MKIPQPAIVAICVSIGAILGIISEHATVKAQSSADSGAGAWEIHTGAWGHGSSTWGYYVIKLNRVTGDVLILDRQDNKPADADHWLRLPEETRQPKK